MVYAVQNRKGDNFSVKLALLRRNNRDWDGLSDSLVGSAMIEVVDVLRHLEQKVSFAQTEYTIKAFSAQATQKSLTERIGARYLDGRPQYLNARSSSHSSKM